MIIWIIILLVIMLFGKYNWLVSADEGVKEAWAQVENQYQRRLDLIDNLVQTVKGFADQELGVFTEVTKARAWASQTNINIDDAEQLAAFQANQWELSGALSRLLVTVEDYPELKSDQNFLELQAQLEWTENRIATARWDFNAAVRRLNELVRGFPSNIVAMITWFTTKVPFAAEAWAEKAPDVDFWWRFDDTADSAEVAVEKTAEDIAIEAWLPVDWDLPVEEVIAE